MAPSHLTHSPPNLSSFSSFAGPGPLEFPKFRGSGGLSLMCEVLMQAAEERVRSLFPSSHAILTKSETGENRGPLHVRAYISV